ncbi:MAG TPA: hypothetical protein VFS17_11035 [Methylophilaceae bacterium]|nr:hypothetical protein [Methylophilaceae bacterium]
MHVQVYLRLDPSMLAQPNDATPVLQHLIAKGSVGNSTQVFEAALCQAFGVEKQQDWPAAALSWLGEGNSPENDFWLYADPVHLQLQRDHFTLSLPVPLPLTHTESEALLATLNRHFAQDGLMFCTGASGQWYMRQTNPSDIAFSFPDQAAGRDVRDFLPRGATAEQWRRLLNEIQMLLHEHPVNLAREERGQSAINSLWFSGAGPLPVSPQRQSGTVVADHPLARGLANWSGRNALALPPDFALSDEKDVLLVPEDGQEGLAQWLQHIRVWLQTRKVKHLTLEIFIHDRHLQATIKPRDLFKFWRKPQPLAAYFSW